MSAGNFCTRHDKRTGKGNTRSRGRSNVNNNRAHISALLWFSRLRFKNGWIYFTFGLDENLFAGLT